MTTQAHYLTAAKGSKKNAHTLPGKGWNTAINVGGEKKLGREPLALKGWGKTPVSGRGSLP